MRELINIMEQAESWPKVIAGWELAQRISREDIHHTPEDFSHGDIYANIAAFDRYDLQEISVASIKRGIFTIHDNLVSDYAARDPLGAPPVIFDPTHGYLIDGNHRLEAAVARGDETILAYVGDATSYHAPEDEDDDGEWSPGDDW